MDLGKVDFSSNVPLYIQVSEVLKSKIENKNLALGQKLPSQDELHRIFNVSKVTIGDAISILVKEGYLASRPTHGTLVISSKPINAENKLKNGICLVSCGYARKDSRYPESFGPLATLPAQNLVFSIEEEIKELGGHLLLTVLNDKGFRINGKENDIAGMILMGDIKPEQLKIAKKTNKPLVLLGDVIQKGNTDFKVDVVSNDDFQAGYMAAKHLVDLGHKRIVYIHYFSGYRWEIDALNGYKTALKEANIDFDKSLQIDLKGSQINDGYEAIKDLINKQAHFSAIVFNGSLLGTGAVNALKENARKIPDDVSVISIGSADREFTTVDLSDSAETGKMLVARLFDKICDPDSKPERLVVRPKLIVRSSTAKII